jgi:hypothetical protein
MSQTAKIPRCVLAAQWTLRSVSTIDFVAAALLTGSQLTL